MIDYWIKRIAAGDLSAFEQVYEAYKGPFIRLYRANQGLSTADALDLYTDACTALFNNIHTGRLTEWKHGGGEFQTYINTIGRNILFNKRRKQQPPLVYDTDKILNSKELEDEYDEERGAMLKLIRTDVDQMPYPCNKLLNLTSFEKKSYQEVAVIMHYASAETVGTQRSRCFQKLKDFVKKQFKDLGYLYE